MASRCFHSNRSCWLHERGAPSGSHSLRRLTGPRTTAMMRMSDESAAYWEALASTSMVLARVHLRAGDDVAAMVEIRDAAWLLSQSTTAPKPGRPPKDQARRDQERVELEQQVLAIARR